MKNHNKSISGKRRKQLTKNHTQTRAAKIARNRARRNQKRLNLRMHLVWTRTDPGKRELARRQEEERALLTLKVIGAVKGMADAAKG